MTEDTQYNSIAEQGSNCPPFVLNAAFDDTPDNLTHVAEIGGTLVRMAVDEDGGVLEYDDGELIHRRVFDDPDTAVDTFRDTVDLTVDEYEERGLEFDVDYSAGDFPVEFRTVE